MKNLISLDKYLKYQILPTRMIEMSDKSMRLLILNIKPSVKRFSRLGGQKDGQSDTETSTVQIWNINLKQL